MPAVYEKTQDMPNCCGTTSEPPRSGFGGITDKMDTLYDNLSGIAERAEKIAIEICGPMAEGCDSGKALDTPTGFVEKAMRRLSVLEDKVNDIRSTISRIENHC